jgi:hypothetical protein
VRVMVMEWRVDGVVAMKVQKTSGRPFLTSLDCDLALLLSHRFSQGRRHRKVSPKKDIHYTLPSPTLLIPAMLLARTVARPAMVARLARHISSKHTVQQSHASDEQYIARTHQVFEDARPALPRFVVQGEKVKPILSPSQFYSDMKVCAYLPFSTRSGLYSFFFGWNLLLNTQ